MVIMLVFGILFMLGLELLIGGLFLGFNSLKIPFVTYNIATESMVVINIFKYLGIITITNIPKLLLLATLAFTVSTLFNNTAIAIAIAFCGSIGAEIINALAYVYKIKLFNNSLYNIFCNYDCNIICSF